MNNSIINDAAKHIIFNNSENVFTVKDYSYKTYITNHYKSHIGYVENYI